MLRSVHQNERTAFAPTVLIIDDDDGVTRRWTKEFHRKTSLGVLVANSIPEGISLATDSELKVDAIVADILFDAAKQDDGRNISDGIEMLRYLTKDRKIRVPMFVVSASHEMMDYKETAEREGVPVLQYYDKLSAAGPEIPAWVDIQRRLLERVFGPESGVTRAISDIKMDHEGAIDVLNETLCGLQLPTRTYIQSLGEHRPIVKRPIEVVCVARSSTEVEAFSPALGLPTSGRGDDVQSAVENLRDVIAFQIDALFGEKEEALCGIARSVAHRLNDYVQIK